MGEIFRYIDGLSAEIETRMRAQRSDVMPHIEAFKARTGRP
jgi:hypothetical protein